MMCQNLNKKKLVIDCHERVKQELLSSSPSSLLWVIMECLFFRPTEATGVLCSSKRSKVNITRVMS